MLDTLAIAVNVPSVPISYIRYPSTEEFVASVHWIFKDEPPIAVTELTPANPKSFVVVVGFVGVGVVEVVDELPESPPLRQPLNINDPIVIQTKNIFLNSILIFIRPFVRQVPERTKGFYEF